jgi:hypothetical protein
LLWDFVDGEVLGINVACETGFEWRADVSKTVPWNAVKEWMGFDFMCTTDTTESVVNITDETKIVSIS